MIARADVDVTPLDWDERLLNRIFASEPAMRMIAERGGGSTSAS